MDSKMDIKVDFPCNLCNKLYSSYKSLWNHNNKFHNDFAPKCTIITQNSTENAQNSTENTLNNCKYCNKSFSRNYCVIRHEKICKLKKNDNNDKFGENDISLSLLKLNFTLEKNSENNIISNINGTASNVSSHVL
jgi:hypothetical protein